MEITIGEYKDGQVAVTFAEGDIRHERFVNACLSADGAYDAAATAARVDQVAIGVAVKIGLGVIVNPDPVAEPAVAVDPGPEAQPRNKPPARKKGS